MEPAEAQIRPKAFGMSMNSEALAGTNLAFSTPSIALVWMLDVPEAGADWMFSIEERICRNGQTSGSAAVGRMLGRTQGASHDKLACGGRRLRDDLNAPSLHRYFCGQNAFYPLNDQGNPLISQQMRPPSERANCNKLLIRKIFSRFLLSHCYSQRALIFVPRNLPCFDLARLGAVLALAVVASLFEPTPREGKPPFAQRRAVA
jgi:hypothetical protein